MNPIPTTNAMKPSPGKGVSSFPTPVIKDTVIVEVVNAWKGDYQPLEYGTKWDDVPHASVQGSYPDHKLISQSPNSEDGQWVKRIWANDRVDQDTYNYAIKYSGGSDAHPIYIRTYLLPRETYTPVPDLSPDPLFPGAFLVDEEVARTEGEFDSRYVQVTRVYETLPGPIIPTQRYNERGDIETVNTQTVPPGTLPDPDGLLVTQSQVVLEDVSKGVKTTATVPSHSTLGGGSSRSGLLGFTSLSDQIVSPSTSPDQLTFTGSGGVLESTVTPVSATKSKKTTITSTGPSSLSSLSLVSSPLGLIEANITKSIVDNTVAPISNEENGFTTLEDSFEALDSVKKQRDTVRAFGSWPTNVGVNYDEQLGIGIYYTETIVKPSDYKNPAIDSDLRNKDYKPIDQWKSIKKDYDIEKISQALLSQYYRLPKDVIISLPDKLISATVYWGGSSALGGDITTDTSASSGSYSASASASSRDSASVNGDMYFNIEKGFNGAVKGNEHIFFMQINDNGRVEQEDILDVLNNFINHGQRERPSQGNNEIVVSQPSEYVRWPYLQTRSENVVLISGGKSKTTSKSKSESASINGFSSGSGQGFSYDVDVGAKSINIPQALHGEIPITQVFTGPVAPGDIAPTYGVFPGSLSTTKARLNGAEINAPTFPAGKYLYSSGVELYKWGFVKITATTVDITGDYV